ncbi:epidermal growth factor receptor substrate 15-like 1 isoform X1 [Salmo salar]|uniref:Epidermal growth factor receptor substrate 15-like 1 isoform X1 n=1 Tax=Salmo salar TaxID=8030 RepID=A0A1S3MNF9_SALSA|nr:epidermal growth factor receptor substrate 15-like 1 isoform X1 [Salmo salar]|eukprot:XP_014004635.1 PREDICTED: epidermal growth factor receptor substrate 15-like 1 isoform X1 [Salmo salar]
MAALTSLTQLSSGNPVYENFYRQVDPGNTGRVGPTEAALFLKKSGLPDVTLGKIWDLADPDGKGFLDKQGFYVALRLVACAQSEQDVSLTSLNLTIPPPKFKDTSSPSLSTSSISSEPHWAVRPEEKGKFDGIFESLAPVSGLLSGDKVKPVLINSKLPLDVLGKVWDLSDIDKDGHLDRDEFAVAMHLVYRALEKEPVPSVLPSSLIPPNKRKKSLVGSLPGGTVPVLPASPPPPKDSLRSTPSHGSMNSLNSAGSLSPKHTLKSAQHSVNWVVPVTDRGRFDEIFLKTDLDLDGFVSGMEVKDIFMHSGLPQNLLAHIWALADTRQMGKLTREQFALAMHFIQQKVSKGMDPPQALTPDMIPPSERGTPVPVCTTPSHSMSGYVTPVSSEMAALSEMRRDSSSSVGSGSEFTGIKELDDISQEIAQLQREKFTLEQDIRDAEEAIRHKSSEVQEMQNDLDRETCSLQELEAQKQDAQERLEEMDQQKAKLEDMLNEVRIQCNEESQMISSLQNQIHSQETDLQSQEEELSRAKADLNRLQLEESQMEQSLTAGKFQLETIIRSLKATQDEINQARSKLSQIQDSQQEMNKSIEQYNSTLNGTHRGSMTNLADMSEGFPDRENGDFGAMEDPFKVNTSGFNSVPQEMHTDPFHSEDPFKTDPFKGDPFQNDPFAKQSSLPPAADLSLHPDPFGGDPFKETDPFKASSEDFFKKTTIKADPFSTTDPFSKSATLPTKTSHFTSSADPFLSISPKPTRGPGPDLFGTLDPFGSSTAFGGSTSSFGSISNSGFADFSQMSKVRDPMEGRGGFPEYQQSGFVEDPFSRNQDGPALPPKMSVPPRPKPPSGKSSPVNLPGGAGDLAKPCDPFQPFGSDAIDPFQSKKVVGDPFSGKDPFAPSASSKASKDSSLGFADFSSFGNEAQQLEWAKRESERAERERLKRLRQQEQEDLELAIALSKAEMSHG